MRYSATCLSHVCALDLACVPQLDGAALLLLAHGVQPCRVAHRHFGCASARFSRVLCARRSTPLSVHSQPLDYGDYSDPAKMTGSRLDLVSHPCVPHANRPSLRAHPIVRDPRM